MHFLSHIYVVVVVAVIIDGSLVCVIMHFIHIHANFTSLLMAVYAFVKKYKMKNSRRTLIVCREEKMMMAIIKKTFTNTNAVCEVWSKRNFIIIVHLLSYIFIFASHIQKRKKEIANCVYIHLTIYLQQPHLFSPSHHRRHRH